MTTLKRKAVDEKAFIARETARGKRAKAREEKQAPSIKRKAPNPCDRCNGQRSKHFIACNYPTCRGCRAKDVYKQCHCCKAFKQGVTDGCGVCWFVFCVDCLAPDLYGYDECLGCKSRTRPPAGSLEFLLEVKGARRGRLQAIVYARRAAKTLEAMNTAAKLGVRETV